MTLETQTPSLGQQIETTARQLAAQPGKAADLEAAAQRAEAMWDSASGMRGADEIGEAEAWASEETAKAARQAANDAHAAIGYLTRKLAGLEERVEQNEARVADAQPLLASLGHEAGTLRGIASDLMTAFEDYQRRYRQVAELARQLPQEQADEIMAGITPAHATVNIDTNLWLALANDEIRRAVAASRSTTLRDQIAFHIAGHRFLEATALSQQLEDGERILGALATQ